ncbi:MAG: HAMP domain-containing histidine kinase [Pirellulales bacterium]|nr:HAMP domain-containing histidine kinase [Pirellulales bacterium]
MSAAQIFTLPPVVLDAVDWRLPLCDATAMDLAQALVEPDTSRQATRLAAALAIDPALAIWARLSAASQQRTPCERSNLDRMPPLAEWLSAHLIDFIAAPAAASIEGCSPEQLSQFAALVAESVGKARAATRGFPYEFAILQPQYLAALTAQWSAWLQAAHPDRTVSEELGRWLNSSIADPNEVIPSTEEKQTADEAWRRWLGKVPGVQALLPPLAMQLRRLRQSQFNFADQLQAAKLDAMKEFAYGAGHEINNPLANIASRAQMLLVDENDPERRRRLVAINTQAFRVHEMLADMMLFARPPKPQFQRVDAARLADDVLSELADEAAAQGTKLERRGEAGPCLIDADPAQFHVALRALCINSLEALGSGGVICIEIQCQQPLESGWRMADGGIETSAHHQTAAHQTPDHCAVQISVADTGPGIPAEIGEKIFDPFFSGREAGRGLGFGLSKCWRIVTLHGGRIEVESHSAIGAKFTITLPANQSRNLDLAQRS